VAGAMEAICSSETSVATQRTTRHHIPEDDTLQEIDVVINFIKATIAFVNYVILL
jgi:hypothetical protein